MEKFPEGYSKIIDKPMRSYILLFLPALISVILFSFVTLFVPNTLIQLVLVSLIIFLFGGIIFNYYRFKQNPITIDLNSLPPVEKRESLYFLNTPRIETQIHQLFVTAIRIYRFLLIILYSSITVVSILTLTSVIDLSSEDIYTFGIFLINFLLLTMLFLRLEPTISINFDELEEWQENVKKIRDFSGENWKLQLDELISAGANTFQDLDLVKRFRGVTRNQELRWEDIQQQVKSFPSGTVLDEALSKGFTKYSEYSDALHVGCPTKNDFTLMQTLGFKTHHDRLLAQDKGYRNAKEWKKGREAGALHFGEYQEMFQRGFLSMEEMHIAEKKGYHIQAEYNEGSDRGFPTAKEFALANKHGIPNFKAMEEIIQFGVEFDKFADHSGDENLYSKYLQALSSDFINFQEYQDATKRGFTKHKDYRTAINSGFSNYSQYKEAKELGFSDTDTFRKALELGYKNYTEFKLGEDAGCGDATTYHILLASGFETWDQYQDAKTKNILDLSTYLSAMEVGAPNLTEYLSAVDAGFSKYKEYQRAKEMGFPNKKIFEEAIRRGVPTYRLMQEIDSLGFDQYGDFETATDRGFDKANDYFRAQKMGAPDYKAYQELLKRGFDSHSEYLAGNALGYPDAQSYKKGLRLQAHNFQEYQILNVENLKREEFVSKIRKDMNDILTEIIIWENEYRAHANDDWINNFEQIAESIEKLEQLYHNVTELYHNLPDYGDTFQELLVIIERITAKLISLETETKTLLTRLYDIYNPIQELLSHLSQITIPGILPQATLEHVSDIRNIGKKKLLELFERFYPDVLDKQSDGETIQVISWVSSMSEQQQYLEKLRSLVLSLPHDNVIAIDRLRSEIGYPGTIEQFEQVIIQVHSREKEIGELDLTNGVFRTPKGDFFEDTFTRTELREKIREILDVIISENTSIPANQVSYQLGSTPTSSFYVALNEVIDEYERVEYSSVTGMIRSIVTKPEFTCPICRLGFKTGQSIGTCSNCKTVFHKNELRQYVLSKHECPQCKKELQYDKIETSVA
ncbi:MAG: hypothetical protein ACXAB7_07000 [Candidatus Kariarchaeaceae archaeon]